MPGNIEPLFTEPGGRWSPEIQASARRAKVQLDHLNSRHLGFTEVLHFYVRINAAPASLPSVVACLNAVQDRIKTRHGACLCLWRLTNAGWLFNWISEHSEEEPRRGLICPYKLTLDELQHDWGCSDQDLSSRETEQERLRFCGVSHEMRDAGLIRYMKDAKVSPQDYLYVDQDVWNCCGWVRGAAHRAARYGCCTGNRTGGRRVEHLAGQHRPRC